MNKQGELTEQEETRLSQIGFVNHLIDNIRGKIIQQIDAGKVPENWDGHELRQLLADRFKDACYIDMDRKRMKEYKNTVLVNNL